MQYQNIRDGVAKLVVTLLSESIKLDINSNERFLLACASMFIERPMMYSNKEDITIGYHNVSMGGYRYFSFTVWFKADYININASEHYSDFEGVYNQDSWVFTLRNTEEFRSREKQDLDDKNFERIMSDVYLLIKQGQKPSISSELLELKMLPSARKAIEIERLKSSLAFYRQYGPRSRADRIEKILSSLLVKFEAS